MAYINPQLQIDQQQDAVSRQNQAAIGEGLLSGLKFVEENRRRALDAERLAKKETKESELYELTKKEALYKEEQRKLPFDQRDDYKSQAGIAALRQKNSPEKMSDKEKIVFKNELEQQYKQPAQNEFAAAGYAKRARQAEADFAKLPKDTGTSSFAALKDWVPNAWVPENLQLADQAKRNFISANLRKESGAAISDAEYENEEKKYFPQPGDSNSVIEQKARSRAQAMANLEAEGARALPKIAQQPGQATQDQKLQRLEQLRAKKAGVAMGGN